MAAPGVFKWLSKGQVIEKASRKRTPKWLLRTDLGIFFAPRFALLMQTQAAHQLTPDSSELQASLQTFRIRTFLFLSQQSIVVLSCPYFQIWKDANWSYFVAFVICFTCSRGGDVSAKSVHHIMDDTLRFRNFFNFAQRILSLFEQFVKCGARAVGRRGHLSSLCLREWSRSMAPDCCQWHTDTQRQTSDMYITIWKPVPGAHSTPPMIYLISVTPLCAPTLPFAISPSILHSQKILNWFKLTVSNAWLCNQLVWG